MSRPLRPEFPGALYHVMSRGNAKQPVFTDRVDRTRFLGQLEATGLRHRWRILGYCLMENHYHLCLETTDATLARGMRDLNGVYAQSFNRRHERVGHLFQSRYKAVVVEGLGQLLEVIRYLALNPVRARLCAAPEDWPWSSHLATLGRVTPAVPLAVQTVLAEFGNTLEIARPAYQAFVHARLPAAIDSEETDNPIVTGSQIFANDVVQRTKSPTAETPRRQRTAWSLAHYELNARSRDEAIRLAWSSGKFRLAEIGKHFGLHYSTVSKICRAGQAEVIPDGGGIESVPGEADSRPGLDLSSQDLTPAGISPKCEVSHVAIQDLAPNCQFKT